MRAPAKCFALLFALLLSAAGAARAATPPTRVLFVGNSLTYVGNLPAVFTALAAADHHPVEADMLVEGGATLSHWLDSGAVARALAAHHYKIVVLQERGGDFACGFGPDVCKASRHALHELARLVRAHGAEPLLLGTYQVGAQASAGIVAAEGKAAAREDVPYIAVSNRLDEARKQYAYFDWFAKAGHPGHDLVLLEATLLYRQCFGSLPQAKTLPVRAPMFVPGSRFAPPAPVSLPLLPEMQLAGGYDYSERELDSARQLAH